MGTPLGLPTLTIDGTPATTNVQITGGPVNVLHCYSDGHDTLAAARL